MAQIIHFPVHRSTRIFTDKLPSDATPKEEALFHVRSLRAQRDTTDATQRKHHVAKILLDWWERELATLVAQPAGVHAIKESR